MNENKLKVLLGTGVASVVFLIGALFMPTWRLVLAATIIGAATGLTFIGVFKWWE